MSKKKIEIPKGGNIKVVWNVFPYDYSKEKQNSIRTLIANKYDIPVSQVEVVPHIKSVDGTEIDGAEIKQELNDLCDPENQRNLFKKYIDVYKIEDYDWEILKRIDNDVNSQISYEKYGKYKKYKLKWLKWDNFLSYGEGNFFNFETLDGLVLISGTPSNQTGKTTFAIDLLHFLLFGSVSDTKAETNADIFNRFIKCSQVKVEGCINIDGTDYVIRRTLSRPQKYTAKSKISGKLEYFRVNGDNNYEELKDFDSSTADEALNESTVQKTNKVIKEAIGSEEDFDMIICSTSMSLVNLIDQTGDTERGKKMARWLGLDVIEDKYKVAKAIHDQLSANYISKSKNKEVLKQQNQANADAITNNKASITICENAINAANIEIDAKEKESDALKTSKITIDQELLKYDKQTIENNIETIISEGKNLGVKINEKQNEINAQDKAISDKQTEIDNFGTVEVDMDQFTAATSDFTSKNAELTQLLNKFAETQKKKADLKNGEFCPTCHQKLQNVNNESLIAECDAEMDAIKKKGALLRTEVNAAEALVKKLSAEVKRKEQKSNMLLEKANMEKDKSTMELAKKALETSKKLKADEYREQKQLLDKYNENKEAIDKNAETDRQILNLTNLISGYRKTVTENTINKANLESENTSLQKDIDDNNDDIVAIESEEVLERNWSIYLEMLGKNGVAKMELRELTPIINIKLKEVLSGVTDFDVEVVVTEKNDVEFRLTNGPFYGNLSTGSGFEKTCAALALRFVLSSITSIPQPNFFVADEILDTVGQENLDKIKLIFDKMIASKDIDFILHCSHREEVKDWHKEIITVAKHNRVSVINSAAA